VTQLELSYLRASNIFLFLDLSFFFSYKYQRAIQFVSFLLIFAKTFGFHCNQLFAGTSNVYSQVVSNLSGIKATGSAFWISLDAITAVYPARSSIAIFKLEN